MLINLSIFFEGNLSEGLVLTKIDRRTHAAVVGITRVNFSLKEAFSFLN